MQYRAGIDIGGTKINIGLLGADARLLGNRVIPIAGDCDSRSVLRRAAGVLRQLCAEQGIAFAEIAAFGIGVPGTVSADGTVVQKAPNLDWEEVPLAAQFFEITGRHATVLQDSRAAAYGEYAAGNGKGSRTLLCITLGTGIGTGIVMNGEIYNGARYTAGELGHSPAVANGRHCGCGKAGCLECYAAGKGLDQTAQELYGADATAKTLFESADAGDAKALEALDQAVVLLGRTIVSAVNLISPDCLLFSGGLAEQKTLYLEPLIRYIKQNMYQAGEAMYIAPAA